MTQNLTRLTVNLTERSSRALELAVNDTGDSRTDTVNRALQVYAYLVHAAKTTEVTVRLEKPDGTPAEKVLIL